MSRFYIVAITPRHYRVIACSWSRAGVAETLARIHEQHRHLTLIVRDGSTGRRYCLAHFLDTWSGQVQPQFKQARKAA